MQTHVFVQPVAVEVDLDRRLRRGDALIVEARESARDGEIVVAETDAGAVIGHYATAQPDVLVYPLEAPGAPRRVPRAGLRLRGVVIGLRSAL